MRFSPLILFAMAMSFFASSCVPGFGLLMYKLASPEILYSQDFKFDESGYTKTFKDINFNGYYILGMTNSNIGFPQDYQFNGILKLQFLYKDKLVQEREVENGQQPMNFQGRVKGREGGVHNFWRQFYLTDFSTPPEAKGNYTLKVTVIKPDSNVAKFKKRIKMVIVSKYE
jgi:hypothetical protein